MFKRGQSTGVPIASLILFIVLFFIIYLFLIPSEERKELLKEAGEEEGCYDRCFGDYEDCKDECDTNSCEDDCYDEYKDCRDRCDRVTDKKFRTLLSESPGFVYPYERKEIKDNLASISLFSTVETDSRTLADSLYISKNLFSDNSQKLSFNLDNVNNVNEVNLLFLVRESKGNLIIKLNDWEIFNSKIISRQLPISLPVEYLKDRNILEISAGSPGWMFLSTSKYDLQYIKLIIDYNIKNEKEQRTFNLYSSDIRNIEKVKLSYYINCLSSEENGVLKVSLNDKLISMYVITCDARKTELDLGLRYLINGENKLIFEIDKGNYILEEVELLKELKEGYYPKYYFSIEEDELKDILDNELDVNLEMKFRDKARKRATILINGESIYLNTLNKDYSVDISNKVVEGENYIKIIPDEEFWIDNLEIWLK